LTTGSVYVWMFGAPLAVVIVGILLASAARDRRARLLQETGRRAIGRIRATGCEGDGVYGPNYWVTVEYPCDGVLITAKTYVSHAVQRRCRVGQRIGLTYSATRTRLVELDSPDVPVPGSSAPLR
jgi:hypothetical protein